MRNEEAFRIGDYFLGKRRNSPKWCACWYDPASRSRNIRRSSLGTEDFREAQLKLAAYVTRHGEMRDLQPATLTVDQLLERYYVRYVEGKLATAGDVVFYGTMDRFFKAVDARTGVVTPTRRHSYLAHLLGVRGFLLAVTNQGAAAATNVEVSDTLPAQVAFVSSSCVAIPAGQVVTWNIGAMASGATAQCTITVQVVAVGSITNTATVSALEVESDESNNSSTARLQASIPIPTLSEWAAALFALILMAAGARLLRH